MPYGFWSIGDGMGSRTRLAVSFTPSSTIDLTHWSLVGKKFSSWHVYFSGTALEEIDHLEWEIRQSVEGGRIVDESRPALATGTIDFSASSVWKLGRVVEYTVVLAERVQLIEGTPYCFVVKTPSDEYNLLYPFAWAFDPDQVDATKYSSAYDGAWNIGIDTVTLLGRVYNEQAGSKWHVIIDGLGYMTPAHMRSYRSEQIASGLAATRGGQEEYSQLLYPYSNLNQESWDEGSGQLDAESPRRFHYAGNMDTIVQHQAIIGPLPHRTGTVAATGIAINPKYETDKVTERQLIDPEHSTKSEPVTYYAQKFFTDLSSYDIILSSVGVRVARLPYRVQYEVQVCICSNFNSEPVDALTGGITGWQTLESHWWWYWQDMPVTGTLTHTTTYWVVVRTTQPWGSLPEHKVMFDRTGSGFGVARYSSDGTTWSYSDVVEQSLIYRINAGQDVALDGDIVAFAYGQAGEESDEAGRYLACAAGKQVYVWNETNDYWENKSAGIGPGDETEDFITDIAFFNGELILAQGYEYPAKVWTEAEGWRTGAPPNLIVGGGFENQADINQWLVPVGTLTYQSGGQVGNHGQLQSGSASGAIGLAAQEFDVIVGQDVNISFWHKDGTGIGNALLYDANSYPGTPLHDFTVTTDATWTNYSTTYVVPTGITRLRLEFDCLAGTSTTTLWDEVYAHIGNLFAKYFHVWGGYLWFDDSPHTIRYANAITGVSGPLEVGEVQWGITGFGEYNDLLLVGKEDGLYQVVEVETGGYLTKSYFTFQGLMDTYNCINMDNWSSQLFIPIQRRSLLAWRGSSYVELGPTDDLSGQSDYYKMTIGDLIPHTRMLFVTMASENWGFGGVMAYNGVGWHHLIRQDYWGVETSHAGIITTTIEGETRVWYARGARPWYFKMSPYTHNRYDDGEMDYNLAVGDLVASWWHGGVKDAFKFWNRVTLIADIPEGTFIEVHFAVDGDDWIKTQNITFLGRLTPAAKAVHGEYTLMFPDGLVAKSIQLIFRLHTTDVLLSPRLRAYNVESIVRQIPVDAYSFRILLSTPQTRLGTTTESERTGEDMWQELKRARAKNAPINVYFPGKALRGMITYLAETTYQLKPVGSEDTQWERVAEITVHEAT